MIRRIRRWLFSRREEWPETMPDPVEVSQEDSFNWVNGGIHAGGAARSLAARQ
jgi:hypothetical protein